MKRKSIKGFTLVELLAVIVILAIILVIAVPRITSVITNSYSRAYDINEKMIEKAAKNYLSINGADISEEDILNIPLEDLINGGFIQNVKDPMDKSTECSGYVQVDRTSGSNVYTPYLKCGDNYTTEGYVEIPAYADANVHETEVPGGYIGIYTIEDLDNIRNNLSGNYILMNNLDFNSDDSYADPSNKSSYTTGEGFLPIGNNPNAFTGGFNGNNYTISNLYINRPALNYVGLFGWIGENLVIQKVGLNDVNITGKSSVGGLVGFIRVMNAENRDTIENVYVTGTVTGESGLGGIAGDSQNTDINNSYAVVDVSGISQIGAIVGDSYYTDLNNVFIGGSIFGTGDYVGLGIVYGKKTSGSFSYYATDDFTKNGALLTTNVVYPSIALQSDIFLQYTLDWDVENVWTAVEGDYPTLGGTTGIEYGPQYSITKIEDLYSMRNDLEGSYTLANDLDFNDVSDYRIASNKEVLTTGKGWAPVGSWVLEKFQGTFDGGNHVISNLYINLPTYYYVGLFGIVGPTSQIHDVGLEDVNVIGQQYVGGLVGEYISDETTTEEIKNVYTTGTVTAVDRFAGGVAGVLQYTNVDNSYSTCTISGPQEVGGFTGDIYGGTSTISNTFAAGDVTGTNGIKVGGFTGELGAYVTFTNSYRNSEAVITGGTDTTGAPATVSQLQNLSPTGLDTWDTSTIWQINAGSYPTFR